jgi:hypothetical protein
MRGLLKIMLFLLLWPLAFLTMGTTVTVVTLVVTGRALDIKLATYVEPAVLTGIYTFGFIPALLTGIAAAVISRWSSGWPYWLWVGLTSMVPSFLLASLVGSDTFDSHSSASTMLGFLSTFLLAGAVAGFACAALFDGLSNLLKRPS